MKLQTAIKPRRDGTVIVQGLDGKSHVFLPDDAGDMVCDIAHEPTVAHLLALDLFMPADEADFARALELTSGGSSGDDENEDEGFLSEGNGLPIEANTPPAPAPAPAPAAAAPASAPRAPARAGGRKSAPAPAPAPAAAA